MFDPKRREFIALVGGGGLLLAAKVKRARGQQPGMPVIGFIRADTPEASAAVLAAFHQGLSETGYVEKQNITIEYRWAAQGHHDQLPALAADLVSRNVAVISAVGGDPSPLAAKAATATIPIIFNFGTDPVRAGLIATFNRPGSNATGIGTAVNMMEPKHSGPAA